MIPPVLPSIEDLLGHSSPQMVRKAYARAVRKADADCFEQFILPVDDAFVDDDILGVKPTCKDDHSARSSCAIQR